MQHKHPPEQKQTEQQQGKLATTKESKLLAVRGQILNNLAVTRIIRKIILKSTEGPTKRKSSPVEYII